MANLTRKIELVIVDDDLGGPYPPPSREPFVTTLGERGFDVISAEPQSAARRSRVIALFGDIRSWKGRPGYSARSLELVRVALDAAERATVDSVIIQFSHPRLAAAIPGNRPVICAWGGEAAMQRAAARVLAAEVPTTG
jgi:hypothetical protein